MVPCISIVTPSYNQAEYIEQTILSIAEQDYPNFEHIVIDGGSTDASPELVARHSVKLKYWVSEKDRGQTHAINKGMARACGDILAYLNSDDYYLPGCFKAVAEAVKQNPDADLFVGRCRYVDKHGNTSGGQFGEIASFEEIVTLWSVWWGGRQFVQPEVFWTRRIAEKVGPFDESLHYVMDYEFWARCLRAGAKVVRIDRELTAFRFTPNQKSNQSRAVARELLEVVRPWLWDPASPISPALRRRLKASWEYDAGFLHLREQLVSDGATRIGRWSRLLRSILVRPRMLTCPAFRRSMSSLLFRRAAQAPPSDLVP